MKGSGDNVAEADGVGFLAADTGIKPAFFRFIKMALTEMVRQELMDKRNRKRFERWIQSEVFMHKFAEGMSKNPGTTKKVLQISSVNKIKAT